MRRFFPSTIRQGGDTLGFQLPNPSDVLAVYSLRRYNDYAGNCIQIVRDSDAAILDIGFVDNVIDTTAIETFCAGTIGKVKIWYDQSGNNNNPNQTNVSARPIIYESGSLITEGTKTSMFWGTTARFELPSTMSVESAFFVYRITAFGTLNTLATVTGTADQIWAGGSFGGVNGFAIRQASATRVTNTSENTNYNLSSFFGGSDDRVYTNSADEAIAGTAFAAVQVGILGRSLLSVNGKYHEAIFYSTSQFANKATIENMINDYYSIY